MDKDSTLAARHAVNVGESTPHLPYLERRTNSARYHRLPEYVAASAVDRLAGPATVSLSRSFESHFEAGSSIPPLSALCSHLYHQTGESTYLRLTPVRPRGSTHTAGAADLYHHV